MTDRRLDTFACKIFDTSGTDFLKTLANMMVLSSARGMSSQMACIGQSHTFLYSFDVLSLPYEKEVDPCKKRVLY